MVLKYIHSIKGESHITHLLSFCSPVLVYKLDKLSVSVGLFLSSLFGPFDLFLHFLTSINYPGCCRFIVSLEFRYWKSLKFFLLQYCTPHSVSFVSHINYKGTSLISTKLFAGLNWQFINCVSVWSWEDTQFFCKHRWRIATICFVNFLPFEICSFH